MGALFRNLENAMDPYQIESDCVLLSSFFLSLSNLFDAFQKSPIDRIDHSESARSHSSSLCAPPSPALKEKLPEIKMPRPFVL